MSLKKVRFNKLHATHTHTHTHTHITEDTRQEKVGQGTYGPSASQIIYKNIQTKKKRYTGSRVSLCIHWGESIQKAKNEYIDKCTRTCT